MRFVPVLALFALSAPALAQETPAAPSAPSNGAKKDPNQVICRRVAATGSILGGKRECHTRAEWTRMSDEASQKWQNRGDNNTNRAGAQAPH